MIIFNEKEYVEKVCLKPKFQISNPDELYLLIRYYIFQGKDICEIKKQLNMMKLGEHIKFILLDDSLFMKAYTKAKTRSLRTGEAVPITKYEYDFVRSVADFESEKILLTLLVIQKFFEGSVFKISTSDIKKLSLTQASAETIKRILKELDEKKYITIVGEKIYKVNIDSSAILKSEQYLEINNFTRIPIPYLKTLRTKDYFFCEICGRKIRYYKVDNNSGRKRKQCKKCARLKKYKKIK